ncbi:MAG: hypothetical protein OEU86_03770 [Gammaproteobacteria bacterium]|nr:hypothetical protein [Gammaproteobacteria bacterium]
MTTGRQDVIKEDSSSPADPFDFGGGHVVPNAAVNPGLIYEAGKQNYEAFLCGLNSDVIDDTACELLVAEGYPTEAGNLNQPSIAISALVSERTVTRSVTNVGDAAVFTAAIETPPGIAVSVTPETLSLNPGESADYDITLAMAGAEPGIWQFGAITWNSSDHSARSPIAARMIEFLTPLEVTGTGASGNLSFDIEFGYTGAYTAMAQGLTAPTVIADLTVTDDSDNTYVQVPLDQQMPDFIWRSPVDMVTTTADDTLLRVALFDESTAGDDDLDLYVYYCPTTLTCDAPWFSGNYDSNEQIDIVLPKPGNYLIDVHGFNTEAASTTFDLFVWTVGSGDNPGNLTMTAPGVATVGTTAEVALSWVGLETQTHLGTVSHSNGEGDPEITVIEIQNPPEEIVTEDP